MKGPFGNLTAGAVSLGEGVVGDENGSKYPHARGIHRLRKQGGDISGRIRNNKNGNSLDSGSRGPKLSAASRIKKKKDNENFMSEAPWRVEARGRGLREGVYFNR